MRKHILLPLIAALTLTACASGGQQTPTPDLFPAGNLTTRCPKTLPLPASGKTVDLLSNHVQVAKAYHVCQEKHQGLVDWMEKTR